jgi:hypothetical protein
MAGPGGKRLGAGRKKGVPNRATRDARAAIARFVDRNAERLQAWLDEIAAGTPAKGSTKAIPPNPERAFQLVVSLIEFSVPKLQRSEVTGQNGAALPSVVISVVPVKPQDNEATFSGRVHEVNCTSVEEESMALQHTPCVRRR